MIVLFALMFSVACQNQEAPKQAPVEAAKTVPTTVVEIKKDTTHVHVFACPMHPEVMGKEGDKCSKCGMALVHKD